MVARRSVIILFVSIERGEDPDTLHDLRMSGVRAAGGSGLHFPAAEVTSTSVGDAHIMRRRGFSK